MGDTTRDLAHIGHATTERRLTSIELLTTNVIAGERNRAMSLKTIFIKVMCVGNALVTRDRAAYARLLSGLRLCACLSSILLGSGLQLCAPSAK